MADTDKYGLSPAEDDPEVIRLLGLIAARWATLDTVLARTLGVLLNHPPAGDVIYYSLESFKARLDVITNLSVELVKANHPQKQLLVTTLNRIGRLASTRNRLIHAEIHQQESGELVRYHRKPGRKKAHESVPVKHPDLLQHANALVEVATNLMFAIDPELLEKVRTLLASPEKPPEPS